MLAPLGRPLGVALHPGLFVEGAAENRMQLAHRRVIAFLRRLDRLLRQVVAQDVLRIDRVHPCLPRDRIAAALDGLLRLFVRNRSYADGLPHKTLLQVFDLLGNDHPLVTLYRRKLYQAIY